MNLVQGGNERLVPDCTMRLAHVVGDAGDWAAARDLYRQTATMRCESQQAHLAVEAQAGLAGVALALDDRQDARRAQLHST